MLRFISQAAYRKALELAPFDPVLHMNLGIVQKDLQQLWPAEQSFRKAIELKPDYATAHQWYAHDYLSAVGRLKQAEQELWMLTAADQPDAAKIEAKLAEIGKLHGDERLSFIRAVGDASKILTDEQRKILTGFAEGNQQLRVNGLYWGLDNWIYGANGRSEGEIRRPEDSPGKIVSIRGHDFRFRPDMVRCHRCQGFRFEIALAVKLAAIEQHLRKARVVLD
jgi:tetratricopeptide (TPR) repeat protein